MLRPLICSIVMLLTPAVYADITVNMADVTGEKPLAVGSINISQNKYGVLLTPQLKGLKPGLHGFHVHVNPSCDKHGDAAGGHLDPKLTLKHLGPYDDNGHLGDLPALYVDSQGNATTPVLAPKMKLTDLPNHSLMIHIGGDNYSDTPAKLGGGGMRMVCGVIKNDM